MNTNTYAVFKKEDGELFFNPNCYHTKYAVGEKANNAECVFVGSLEECTAMVESDEQEASWADFGI